MSENKARRLDLSLVSFDLLIRGIIVIVFLLVF